jgi:hypothetical protein
MKVVVKKKALINLLETIAEGRTGDSLDMMHKFIDDKEPIKPVEMMATQLATQKPNVADPEYMPATVDELGDASMVIANEVPDSQIEFYYRKLHELLDDALDRSEESMYEDDELNESKISALLRQLIKETDGSERKPQRRVVVRRADSGEMQTREFGDEAAAAEAEKEAAIARMGGDERARQMMQIDYTGVEDVPPEQPDEESRLDKIAAGMTGIQNLAMDIRSAYNKILGNYLSVAKMKISKSDLDALEKENPFVIGTAKALGAKRPSNENERYSVILKVIREILDEQPRLTLSMNNLVTVIAKERNISREAAYMTVLGGVAKALRQDTSFIPVRREEAITKDDVISAEANRIFDQMVKAAGVRSRSSIVRDEETLAMIEANMKEYFDFLKAGDPTIELSGHSFDVSDFMNEIIQVFDSYKKSQVNLAADIEKEGGSIRDLPPEIEKDDSPVEEVEARLKQSGKWSDMAPWFEFSGESGIRQWYLKHIASKFEILMKGGQAGEANPGAKAFREGYSNSILYIIDSLIEYIPDYIEKKTKEGSAESMQYAQLAQDALQDIEKIQDLSVTLENILDVEGDMESDQLTDMLANSIGGNIISNVNSEKFKKVTTFLMDKVGPDLAKSAYEDEAGLEKVSGAFIEAVTGKSEPPDFSDPTKSKAKKMIAAGVTPEVFARVLEDYQQELDMYLKTAFDKGGELFNVIEKSDKISDKELKGAFDEYIVSLFRQSKEESIGTELQELYTIIKSVIK